MSYQMLATLMAGLGLFLYGMKMMGDGLEKVAGDNLRKLLDILTRNKLVAVLVGALFTAIIQSSSATTVMVVGFVNAGLMNLMQATGVIMGANIGTTMTSVLIALKLTDVAPLFLFAGVVMILFLRSLKLQRIGGVLAGFGILFLGMDLMSSAMEPLRDMPEFVSIMSSFSNPALAILAGLAVTALIQSSSASVGLIQVLAMQRLVPLETAMFLILGTNIGTCVTALLASMGTTKMARRAAMVHLLLNVLGTILLFVLIQLLPVNAFIRMLSLGGDPVSEVATANILFKVFEVAVFFPFEKYLVKLTVILVPGEDPKTEEKRLMYIDDRILSTPHIAVVQVCKEVERMGRIAVDNLKRALYCFFEEDEDGLYEVAKNEEVVNYLNHEITSYMVKASQLQLQPDDTRLLATLFHVVNDLERIGDHAENMSEFAEQRYREAIPFSESGIDELKDMFEQTFQLCNQALEAFHTRDRALLPRVLVREEHIDDLEKALQQAHVDRLTQGQCTPQSGMIFSDILSNLERVADHATNIAFSIEEDAKSEPVKNMMRV